MKHFRILAITVFTLFSFNVSAKVYTTPADISKIVSTIDVLNKRIVGLSSVSTQKFYISKIDLTKAISDNQIGLCTYGYTVYLENIDSNVKEALDGKDFFSDEKTVVGMCKFNQ